MAEQQDRDQRTEQATPNRIRKAYEEGQIGFSSELVGSTILLAGVAYFWMLGFWFFNILGVSIQDRVGQFPLEPLNLVGIIRNDVFRIGLLCLSLMLPLFFIALTGGLLQTNFNISFKPLNLKWEKMSVPAGFKRIFSSSSAVRGALAVAKATIIVFIVFLIAKSQLATMADSGNSSFQAFMFAMCRILLLVALSIAALMTIVGIIDLAFQKWKHLQDLKMSVKDIRDERKDIEGDPLMRARLKQLQADSARNRIVEAVRGADAVVRNPTHFAVAIKYDRTTMIAPTVVAKGRDFLAQRIIEVAEEAGVPVIERKPVARFLYFNIKVGHPVPIELYQAVAEILNYVNRLKNNRAA